MHELRMLLLQRPVAVSALQDSKSKKNSFPYAYIAGHTLTLKVMNPSSTVTDSISSGSWTL